jgi:flagellar biosynthesis GTPase FlhF
VFDPLAVLLLIASQYSIEGARTKNRRKEDFMAEVTSEGYPMNPDNRASQKAFEKIIDIANTRVEEEANEEESEEQDKKDEEYNPERAAQYAEKEKDEEFVNKKTQWKTDHPDETLKHYKRMYINGTIDSLPWE